MPKLIPSDNLDKDLLVKEILEQFSNSENLFYKRSLVEFFDNQGQFIGDYVFEATFQAEKDQAPLIYEVSGPYDPISNKAATTAKIYRGGELLFLCDIEAGAIQRAAAMAWIYLDALKKTPGKTLLISQEIVDVETAAYLKHFFPELEQIDYQDVERKIKDFEEPLERIGLQVNYQEKPDLSVYDTIIFMAPYANPSRIDEQNISMLKRGCVVISFSTTSQSADIDPEIYQRDDINIFLDYEDTKTFSEDMVHANDLGHLEKAITLTELLSGNVSPDLEGKVNLVRLTGTPMQNIAVIGVVLERENLKL